MAVTKIWPVRGKVESPLNYAANEEKTYNPRWDKSSLQNLTDVMHYAADEDKTEKQFFVTGINCNVDTARDQFVTVKKQFDKEDGIVAYHGYQSFAEGEVSPETAHAVGVEFAKKVWRDDYQVVVATHLNTNCYHNHFVVNSVSFKHGKRCRAKQWYDLNKISDEICMKHGLSVVEIPKGKGLPNYMYEQEKHGGATRLNIARKAVDEAIEVSSNMKEFEIALKSMGYTCSFSPTRKYWTIKLSTWEKVMRLERLGPEYSNDKIMERVITAKDGKDFAVFQRTIYVKRQYRMPTRKNKIKKVGGLKGLYLHYCYLLGYLPQYKQKFTKVSPLLRDDLIKLDRISEEAKLLCRENISTAGELVFFKGTRKEKIAFKGSQRDELKKTLRRKGSPEEKAKIKGQVSALTKDLAILRKEMKIADSIEERCGKMESKIKDMEREVKNNERRR